MASVESRVKRWFEDDNKDTGVVLSSRIRLARNCKDINFAARLSKEQLNKLNSLVILSLENVNFGNNKVEVIHMDGITDVKRSAMIENHSISVDFGTNFAGKILLLSQDNSISVMVGEEDHLRIQVCMAGTNLGKAYELANMVDDVLDAGLSFAFDERLGYLTACPTNVGTGMRASVMVHIPALEAQNKIKELSYTLSKLGLTIRGSYGEGSRSVGSTYQISNQITLGITEKEIIDRLMSVIQKITDSELETRRLMVQNSLQLRDRIMRSYGIIGSALLMSSEEAIGHLSNLRIGVTTGLITDIDCGSLLAAQNRIPSANICDDNMKGNPEQIPSPAERDEIRAGILRNLLSKK